MTGIFPFRSNRLLGGSNLIARFKTYRDVDHKGPVTSGRAAAWLPCKPSQEDALRVLHEGPRRSEASLSALEAAEAIVVGEAETRSNPA